MNGTPLRLLFALPHGNHLGGVGSWTRNLATELSEKGGSVSVLVHNGSGPNAYAYPRNVRLHKLAGPPSDWAFRRDIAEVVRFLDAEPPTVFFPNGGHCGYAAAARIKRSHKGLHVVGIAHSDEDSYYETLKYYEPIIDRFIGVSYAITGKLLEELPAGRKNDVICLPYGVPVHEEVHRMPGNPLKLLYAGRIAEQQKRVSRLAELASALSAMNIPFEFHLAGDGPARQVLEASMESKAVFHGSLDTASVQKLMNQCDIIIQLSDFEGTSLTMLEGMAAGMVPVMSAVSGIDAVIKQGVSGFIQPIGDVETAAKQIAMLHHDRGLMKQMGEAARCVISRDFSISGNANRIAELADELTRQSSIHRRMGKSIFPLTKECSLFNAKARGKIKAEFRRVSSFFSR